MQCRVSFSRFVIERFKQVAGRYCARAKRDAKEVTMSRQLRQPKPHRKAMENSYRSSCFLRHEGQEAARIVYGDFVNRFLLDACSAHLRHKNNKRGVESGTMIGF
jgi:hypothetical protein